MESSQNFCSIAEAFTKNFFKLYLEDRDFEAVKRLLHSEITWVGTGKHEICRNYKDAIHLLDEERDAWDGSFQILEYWSTVLPISADCCTLYGEMKIREAGDLNTILLDMESRLSLVCKLEHGQPKVYHAHFSVANSAQSESEFVHKQMVADYNVILEQKLQERTDMLKETTRELEVVANNLLGGIIICACEPDFPILYASDGFYHLCGYTREELSTRFASCNMPLVYEPDRPSLSGTMTQELNTDNTFSSEYRIHHKDGHLVWVLERGTLLPLKNGISRIQCVLTDITLLKEQQEALRISERRYITALSLSEATIFEYDIIKKQLIFFDDVADMYGVPNIVENGVDTFIRSGIIEPATASDYRAMYQKIHAGEPYAECFISTRDKDGLIHDFQLRLSTIYDDAGQPVHALGVRKNIAQLLQLQKEQAYSEMLTAGKRFLCEVDLATNQILQICDWLTEEHNVTFDMLYHDLIEQIVRRSVFSEDKILVLSSLSAEYIATQFESGVGLYSFYYRRYQNGAYFWYECTANVIRNQQNSHLNLRLYHEDVHDRKLKEQRAQEEQQLYETMVAKANIAYEINVTRDLALKGHENWDSQFGIPHTMHYKEMIYAFAQQGIHPDDTATFTSVYARDRLLECFSAGQRRIPCEYRRLETDNNYRWVVCTLHLYTDPNSGDVKGFSYVEDIDDQKRAELDLRYSAQHDMMTGLYNKSTVAIAINSFLEEHHLGAYCHAFFMVDIDHFKQVNDTFGHPFGDVVLSEVAARIKSVFRVSDLVGRIGGDEFCAFMKDVPEVGSLHTKAQELCDRLRHTYSRDGRAVTVSASVGIAMFSHHGTSYKELFEQADKALYCAKKNGRDQFALL